MLTPQALRAFTLRLSVQLYASVIISIFNNDSWYQESNDWATDRSSAMDHLVLVRTEKNNNIYYFFPFY